MAIIDLLSVPRYTADTTYHPIVYYTSSPQPFPTDSGKSDDMRSSHQKGVTAICDLCNVPHYTYTQQLKVVNFPCEK